MAKQKRSISLSEKVKSGKLGLERLESRQLLAANVLASTDSAILALPDDTDPSGDRSARLELSIDAQTPRVLLGLMATPIGTGNQLDPAAPRILHNNGPIATFYSAADLGQNRQAGLALAELRGGLTYTVMVSDQGQASGPFRLDVLLPGDLTGDAAVDRSELVRTTAALVQSQFGGNHVSGLLFRQNGLNVSRDLYHADLDTNLNGVIDAFDLNTVRRNVGLTSVSVQLAGDEAAPQIQAAISPDTGLVDDDGLTNDAGAVIRGTLVDGSAVTAFEASIDTDDASALVNLLAPEFFAGQDFRVNPNFTLTLSQLEQIAGTGPGSLTNSGPHTLFLKASDEFGNATEMPVGVPFELDTIAPPAPGQPVLVGDGDGTLMDNTPTFTVDATADVVVQLFSNLIDGPIGESMAGGTVTITSSELPDGTHRITATATDSAGNQSSPSDFLQVVIDASVPELTAFDFSPPATQMDAEGNPLTANSVVMIAGATEAGANVELFQEGLPLGSTTSDQQGRFSFSGISLAFGQTPFTITVTDTGGNAPTFERTLTRDDPPVVASPLGDRTLDEDDPAFSIDLNEVFTDPNLDENDTLTFSASVSAPTVLNVTVQGGTLVVTPRPEQIGSAVVTVRATDSLGLVAEDAFSIEISQINDSPVITAPASLTVAADAETAIPGISVSDVDLDESGIIISLRAGRVEDSPESLRGLMTISPVGDIQVIFGSVSQSRRISFQGSLDDVNATLQTLRYLPEPAGFEGSRMLTVIANDFGITGPEDQQQDEHVIDITVVVNDPPVANEDEFAASEEQIVTGNVLDDNGNGADVDPDGDNAQLIITNAGTISSALDATVTLSANGDFTYDPTGSSIIEAIAGGQTRIDLFEYVLSDGVSTAMGTVIVRLTGVNNPPVARDDRFTTDALTTVTGNVLEDNGNGADTDVDSTLVVTTTGTRTSSLGATVTLDASGNLTYNPLTSPTLQELGNGEQRVDTFQYTISDGTESATATVSVTVSASANAPPVALGDTAQVDAGSTNVSINVLANDTTEDDGETLTIASLGAPDQGGTVTIAPGGTSVRYTPAPGFLGNERFTYTINDGRGGTAQGGATIQVTTGQSALGDHIHANLSIYVNGERLANPPANIGVTSVGFTSPIHTHASDGVVHIHPISANQIPAAPITVGDFFVTWRTNAGQAGNNSNAIFNQNRIFNNMIGQDHVIRMFVNGVPNSQFQNYVIENEDQIVISYEPVSDSGTPTIVPIPDVTLEAGAPLHVPLDGFDFEGDTLTFTASSSNPALVSTSVPQGNRSMRISVADFGVMTFELFDDRAPRVTDFIAALADDGVYDDVIFHRVIGNFVIQGGDPTGTGFGDPSIPDFDDQFHVDLQHTSVGVLSMAKAGDDTNSSQFFITARPTRFLDFNHSVFGQLIEGENTRRRIAQVPTGDQDRPEEDVVMQDVSIIVDQENAVLMLKAPEGASGQADVTVTVSDGSGGTSSRTFHVTVVPDASNGGPYLEDVADITTTVDSPVEFEIRAVDVEGDPVEFDASVAGGTSFNFALDDDTDDGFTARILVTPPDDFEGTLQLRVEVRAADGSDTLDPADAQVIPIQVSSASPLAAQSVSFAAMAGQASVDQHDVAQVEPDDPRLDELLTEAVAAWDERLAGATGIEMELDIEDPDGSGKHHLSGPLAADVMNETSPTLDSQLLSAAYESAESSLAFSADAPYGYASDDPTVVDEALAELQSSGSLQLI